MPNHVINILHVHKASEERFKEFKNFVKGKEADEDGKIRLFDFNSVIPRSPELDIPESSQTDSAMKYVLAKAKSHFALDEQEKRLIESVEAMQSKPLEDYIAIGKQALSNIAKYGYKTWYDWNRNNWGTKWNAYDVEEWYGNSIKFLTAWSTPTPIYKKLAELFPDLDFEVQWHDEGGPSGIMTFGDGKLISDEDIKLDLWGWGEDDEDYEDEDDE